MNATRIVLFSFLLMTGCSAGLTRVEVTNLKGSLQPLRERFNADQSLARVVALLSPT